VLGTVRRVVGLNVEVAGLRAPIGSGVRIIHDSGAGSSASATTPEATVAEVVAVSDDALICMPLGGLAGVQAGMPAELAPAATTIPVTDALLGRVIDGLGRPIDGLGPIVAERYASVDAIPPDPMRRARITEPLSLGVRAVDTLIPIGRGQRVGIFAGSGVGKSSILSMFARGTDADVNVLALVGERGREVREFIEADLGPEGLARSVVVVSTSDQPALLRLRAAFTATRIAEHFRDDGRDVLLMMDSLTRFCMAQREIGLSAGEPPATRGYPPSVFALLPKLLERAGAGERGSITGLYTVLIEGDDLMDPVGDAARSILDGHIVLSRRLATAGHFPSIDVLESISRVFGAVTTPEQRRVATQMRALMAAYRDARDLVEIGAYVAGTNPLVDRAIQLHEATDGFLRQDLDELTPALDAWARLEALVGGAQT
jgi:flagellum-specific ATP synthase